MRSIARGDYACDIELKNSWPSVRARPGERRRESRLCTRAATRMTVADEDWKMVRETTKGLVASRKRCFGVSEECQKSI